MPESRTVYHFCERRIEAGRSAVLKLAMEPRPLTLPPQHP